MANCIIQDVKVAIDLNGASSNHSLPDFHAVIQNNSLLEVKNTSVATATFTFCVNYNHFI